MPPVPLIITRGIWFNGGDTGIGFNYAYKVTVQDAGGHKMKHTHMHIHLYT